MFLAAREKKELMKGCMVKKGHDKIQMLKMHPCSGVREKLGLNAGLQIWAAFDKGSDMKYKNQMVCPSKHKYREKGVERQKTQYPGKKKWA